MKNIKTFLLALVVFALAVGFYRIATMPSTVLRNTMEASTSVDEVDELTLQGPLNQIAFAKGMWTADTDVAEAGGTGPMADMLYAQGWLDLDAEPMVFDLPAFGDRYFVMPLTDAQNVNTGYIGSRTTGNEAGRFAIVGPEWEGEIPTSVERIDVSTRYVNFILRVFVAGPDDFNTADQLRRQTKLYPLSELPST